MRILKVEITNLATIENAVVDFECDELSRSSIFLITGQTGSGKTTILDALSVALYGKTPRQARADGSEKFTDKSSDFRNGEISVDDPRLLMRRAAASAESKVTFEGSDGKRYCATWFVKRNRNGVLNEVKRSLVATDDAKFAPIEGKTAVNAEVERLVGLNYDQFCKTTMLAQGEFMRFLNSKSDEKAALLAKMIDCDIYERIGKAIGEKYNGLNRELDAIKARLEGITLMSKEEVDALKSELDSIKRDEPGRTKDLATAQANLNWLKADNEYDAKIKECEAALENANNVCLSDDYKTNKAKVDLWDKSADVRATMAHLSDEESNLKSERDKGANKQRAFVDALASRSALAERINSVQEKGKNARDKLASFASIRTMLDDSQSIAASLAEIASFDSNLTKLSKELTEKKGELTAANARLKKAKECDAKNADALAEATSKLEELTEKRNKLKPKEVNDSYDALTAAQVALLDAKLKNGAISEAEKAVSDSQDKIEKTEVDLNDAEKRLQLADAALESAKTAHETVERLVGHIQAIVASHSLSVGDECPLCHAKVVRIDADEDLCARVEEVAKRYSKATKERKDCKDKRDALSSELKTEKGNLKSLEAKRDKAKLDIDGALKALKDKLKETKCELDLQKELNIESVEKSLDEALKDVKGKKKQIDKLEKEIEEATTKKNKANDDKSKSANELTKADSETSSIQKRIGEIEDEDKSTKGNRATSWEKLRSKILYEEDWSEDKPGELKERIVSDAKALSDAESSKAQCEKELASLSANSESVERAYKEIVDECKSWSNLQAANSATEAEPAKVERLWDELRSDIKVWVQAGKAHKEEISRCKNVIDAYFADHPDIERSKVEALLSETQQSIAQCRSSVESADKSVVAAKSARDTQVKSREAHAKKRPALKPDDNVDTLQKVVDDAQELIRKLTARRAEIDTLLSEEQKKVQSVGQHEKEKQGKLGEIAIWQDLYDAFGKADGKKMRTAALRFVFQELLHYANQYLQRLTGGRFELLCNSESLVIQISDAYHADALQTTTNLSGGESFQVSLALALGLSAMAAGTRATSDILFIDEGFGTLDQTSLDNVMQFLGRLQEEGGRRVGIISHVDLFRERIPAQIRVERISPSSSAVVIADSARV